MNEVLHCLQAQLLATLPENARLLHLGCADGAITLLLARHATHVVACDGREDLLAVAQTRAADQGVDNVEFHHVDACEFSTHRRFDAVCLIGELAGIDDDKDFSRLILRVLSMLEPGGQIILQDAVVTQGGFPALQRDERSKGAPRSESRYLALVRSLGLREVARHPLQAQDEEGQTSFLYVMRPVLGAPCELPIGGLRVACYGSMPFHFRSLRPLAACFETSLLSLSIDEVMAWKPQVIVVADGWSVEFWRDYCDAHNVLLVGMRHGSVTRYGFAEPQYKFADYMCGSVWDIEDTLLSNVQPRHGFLMTGNSWVDQVFRLPARSRAQEQPTILFAPTYNPEISAAVYFGDRVVPLIRSVYPQAKIIIKPHPAIVQHEHSFVVDKALFRNLMLKWREQVAADPLVRLVDDPEASIADSFAEADILVADRSSLLFEFMVLDRPILLYSSEKRVGHWEYNPDAPGNAWRDIGMEFVDEQGFQTLLSDAYALHARHCRDAQRERVQHLYGDFQDGRSVERVAAAIASVPRLHVVIDGRSGADNDALSQALDERLAFKRITRLREVGQGGDVDRWLAERRARAGEDLAYLLISGDSSHRPGTAHQVSDGLAALASGSCDAQVLSEPGILPMPGATDSKETWVRQRLCAALERRQGRSAWQLLPAHTLVRSFGQLPSQVDDDVFSVLWQSLVVEGCTQAWQSERLNVVLGSSLVRVVGARRTQYLAGPMTRMQLMPAVQGISPAVQGMEVLLCCASGQQYDVFPFTTELWVNGQRVSELHFSDTRAQRLLLPYTPDERGATHIELRSGGAFPGMSGLAGPLSLYLAFIDPVPDVGPAKAHIHQIFYSEETRAMLDAGFTPFDNIGQRPDWAEYWPIRSLLMDKALDENAFYAVLSPRFKHKTGLGAQQVFEFIASAPSDADVLLFPMFFDESALYENVFIQGLIYHPNIWPVCVEMARRLAPGVDLETLVMDARHSQFCNYFVAKPRFWRRWLAMADTLFQAAEQARNGHAPTPYGSALNAATYHRGTAGYEIKVFVMERLLPLILATEAQWKVHAYDPLKLPVMRHPVDADFIELDALKVRLREHDSADNRQAYAQLRDKVVQQKAAQKNPDSIGKVRPVAETIRIAMHQYPLLPVATDVSAWLAARVPSAPALQLIEERLRSQASPVIGVLVIDSEGDAQRLAATLESLTSGHNLYSALKIVVLRPGEAQEPTAAHGKLRFMQLEDDPLPVIGQAVREGEFDWFMLVDAGSEFTTSGLLIAALDLLDAQGLRAVYGDEVVRCEAGAPELALRPDLNLDMLLSVPGLMACHWLYNSEAWRAVGGFRASAGRAFELDLILRLIEDQGFAGLGHISEPLLVRDAPALQDCADERQVVTRHLHARGYLQAHVSSRLPGHLDASYGVDQPMVSIVVSTMGGFAKVRRCMESILEKTVYRAFEVLLLDHGNDDPTLQTWLAGVEAMGVNTVRVVCLPADLSLAQARNNAAMAARGELLLLLDVGCAVLDSDWLQQLVNHAARHEVGAVGAKLVDSECTVRQGGLVLGFNGPAEQVFTGYAMNAGGYMQRLQVDQNAAALSGRCLMLRKSRFLEVGGFEVRPELAPWADVDLCLRLNEQGYLNVWTPRAVLLISEAPVPSATVEQENAMYARWLPVLARDPGYNSNFALGGAEAFAVSSIRLNWNPLSSWAPIPTVLVDVSRAQGHSRTRIVEPLTALHDAGWLNGIVQDVPLSVTELERLAPDSIILSTPIDAGQLRRMRAFSKAFKVLQVDNYSAELITSEALGHVDRLVVPTQALADAFANFHGQVQVVPACLDPQAWGGLEHKRRTSARPRVGWSLAAGQVDDLVVIAEAVQALANDVEWVFLGACPEALRPYVHEWCEAPITSGYSQVLAHSNLDLALLPLLDTPFNRCKSRLPLLEYGFCGVPVICSDVMLDCEGLPVRRVGNTTSEWLVAIRQHLADLDATACLGDALQACVRQSCLANVEDQKAWRLAWLPS